MTYRVSSNVIDVIFFWRKWTTFHNVSRSPLSRDFVPFLVLQDWVINDYWSFTNEKAEMQDLLIIWDKDLEEEVKRCKTGSKLRSDLIHIEFQALSVSN